MLNNNVDGGIKIVREIIRNPPLYQMILYSYDTRYVIGT